MSDGRDGRLTADGVLKLLQAWLPILTAVCGGVWALNAYFDQHATEANKAREAASVRQRTEMIEAQKPFIAKQLDLYFETAQLAGRLATEDFESEMWKTDRARFEQLYWSELTMVEHVEVEAAMADVRHELERFETAQHPPAGAAPLEPDRHATRDPLQSAMLGLARALRRGVEQSWSAADSGRIVAPPRQ